MQELAFDALHTCCVMLGLHEEGKHLIRNYYKLKVLQLLLLTLHGVDENLDESHSLFDWGQGLIRQQYSMRTLPSLFCKHQSVQAEPL
jgi:hypothetical protein